MSSIAPYLLPLLIWAVLYTNAAFPFKQDDILKRVHLRENSRNHPTFKVNTQNDVLLERMEDPLSAFRHGAIERRQSGQWGEWSDWSPCKPSTVYYDESFHCTIEYEIPTQRERRRECDAPSCDGDDIEIEFCTDTFTCSESNYCIIDGMDYGHVSYIFDGNCNIAYCILGGVFEESNICEGTTCPVGLPHETIPEGTMLCGSPLVLTAYAFLDNIIVEQCPIGYTCNYALGEYTFGVCCPACEFNCVNSDECIPNAMICDSISQCGDGSDELNCGQWGEWSDWSSCTPISVYYYDNFTCISNELVVETAKIRYRECDISPCEGDGDEYLICDDTFTCSESKGTTCPVGLPYETVPEGSMLCGSHLVLTALAFLDNIIVEQCPIGYTCNYPFDDDIIGVCCTVIPCIDGTCDDPNSYCGEADGTYGCHCNDGYRQKGDICLEACDFNCIDTDECFSYDMICDGISQCGDGSDENNCGQWGEWGDWSPCTPIVEYIDENLDCIVNEVDTWQERWRDCIDSEIPCYGSDYERTKCDEPLICVGK
ncbi:uncharacterized protein LOC144435384 [Glandiceps talaboti]